MIRLLIDECLSPALAKLANDRGIEATHVNYLGLNGFEDRALVPIILARDFTLVTHNRGDFVRIYRSLGLHAGLIVILPKVKRDEQQALLGLALDAIEAAANDMVNQLVEVDLDGRITMSAWPLEGSNLPK